MTEIKIVSWDILEALEKLFRMEKFSLLPLANPVINEKLRTTAKHWLTI